MNKDKEEQREIAAWEAIQEIQDYIEQTDSEFDRLLLEFFAKSSVYQNEIKLLRENVKNPANIDEIQNIETCTKMIKTLIVAIDNQRHHLRRLREAIDE